ncbi:MAG: nicotinate phosphoribosyltransferase [Tepidisphaeraceae bacterium]
MSRLSQTYRPNLALLTDLYQLTMAAGYFACGRVEQQACFHLYFRRLPFDAGYAVLCGIADAMEWMESFRFTEADVAYLATLKGNDGRPIFSRAFLEHLLALRLSVDVDAMPEGTVAFGSEPLLRVTGSILQCQLLETALLTLINFPTLVATKAARIVEAAQGDPVIEFGLRRAQGVDGALTAARAAYVGGAVATSDVLAGQMLGIPVAGTHAHSWVMSFDSEADAFDCYAKALPNNCIFLVDTYDTLEGVRRAAKVGQELARRGHAMIGIRLDSGDLAYLSIEARKILDAAGLPQAKIVASNDLDESIIASLKQQGARIDVWGVGTKLVTAYDQPALGGVYKLGAVQQDGKWKPVIKASEQAAKASLPGVLNVRRYRNESTGQFVADAVFDATIDVERDTRIVDPADPLRHRTISSELASEDLLMPVIRGGKRIGEMPSLDAVRNRARAQINALHPTIRRQLNPHEYPAGLEYRLAALRMRMIDQAKGDGAPILR